MRKATTLLAAAVTAFLLSCSGNPVERGKVLVYTRNGVGYLHDNIEASVTALKAICESEGLEVDVSDDPEVMTDERLKNYLCIILSNTNNETIGNDQQKEAFVRYVHAGGSVVGIHSASGSERDWPWFREMLGGKFERHPPIQEFEIKVINHEHPSTSFMGDRWSWEDECYYLKYLNPDLTFLLAADLSTVEDEGKSLYPGEVFGNYFPLAWYHVFEGGRVFYTALGHKIEHYSDPDFTRHLAGAIEWAIGDMAGPDYSRVTGSGMAGDN